MIRVASLLLGLFLVPIILSAHHSRAEFSEVTEEIRGEILAARWTNPHPEITLRARAKNGSEETLTIQVYGAANNLRQAGVTDDLFSIGDEVTIAGQRSTRRPRFVLGSHMLLVDGRQAVFSRTLEPHWSVDAVGGLEDFVAGGSGLADGVAENRGLFRMWSFDVGAEGAEIVRHLPLTEAAKAGQAEFDQESSWIGRREAPGMPAFMNGRNNFEFFDDGDTIRYEQGVFGIVRTIYLPESAGLDNLAPSALGYSVGRWEGNTLVIETSRLNWPYLSRAGVPLSENVKITERFTVSDDQTRLDYHMTIVDPVNFTEPATMARHWVALENPTPDERYIN